MADFRKWIYALAVVALLAGFTIPASAQIQCNTASGVPPTVQAEGYTVLLGDITLSCGSGFGVDTETIGRAGLKALDEALPTASAKVRLVMAGIRRNKGTAQRAKKPVLVDDLRNMIACLPTGLLGSRNRALLSIGFCGAFRRSELVGLDVTDMSLVREGLVVTLRRSKTDQEGEGRKIGIPYALDPSLCPIGALQAWFDQSGIVDGPLFRPVNRHGRIGDRRLSAAAVADVVKRAAAAVGLDSAGFAGHSLRSGLATSAAAAGASERAIMLQTGHKSLGMVRRYIRDGDLFRANAAAGLL